MDYKLIEVIKHPFALIWSPFIEWLAKIILAAKPVWYVDYEEALLNANQNGKIVLANFTGSDWCPHCINLKKEVFNTVYFWLWANKNVILLELYFPNNPEDTIAQNQMLQTKYGVNSYPTVIGINADGSERGRVSGYSSGTGVINWISMFETVVGLNTSPANDT
ncbi:thioredoxin family protein (plasmid) [Methylomarinum sp. Ch1-1]|uniref:Thioredoxin family protein n=1 Tax=Methylomarinum roseum TaxID=3067653 RepID=A0AAU7NPY8_9GAMM|nr:thioredoxin family protein [Methylomarinum sp. Ch1-1]MDP4523073.1 thioredoxin family protein [Methylomarinum sp. Ch1-1]